MENLSITLDGINLDSIVGTRQERYQDAVPLTLADLIVERAAQILAESDSFNDLKHQVRQLREQAIKAAVEAEVAAALDQPFQATNSYGEPQGQPMTLRELIGAKTEQALKSAAASRDSYRGNETVLDRLIREEVGSKLEQALKTSIKDEKARIVATMQARGAEIIAQIMKDGLR